MLDKPDIANYPMDTRERILTKTIMEIVDKSKIIRNDLQSLEWPYVTVLPGKDQESYYRHNLEDSYLLELIDMAETYIGLNPKLGWLSSKEREYIKDYGFWYTNDEKKKTWKITGGGAGDYMSDWYIWINGKEKFVESPQHRC